MKAAVALARLGDKRGKGLVKRIALERNSPGSSYAVRYLPMLLGEAAGQTICDLVKRSGGYPRALQDERQAMWLVNSEAAVPLLVDLLSTGPDSGIAGFALDCLADRGPNAEPAVPALVKVLEADGRRVTLVVNQRLAARVLGRIGRDAAVALPALTGLAEKFAEIEWDEARSRRPEPLNILNGEVIYSRDEFVNAIWQIRQAIKAARRLHRPAVPNR
jgi:hypothetical protein